MKRNEILNLLISESIKEVILDIEKNYLILENKDTDPGPTALDQSLNWIRQGWNEFYEVAKDTMTIDLDGTTLATMFTFLGSLTNIFTLPHKAFVMHAVGGMVSGIFYAIAGFLYLRESDIAMGDRKQQFSFLGWILIGIGFLQLSLSAFSMLTRSTGKRVPPVGYKQARDAAGRLSFSAKQMDDLAANGVSAFNTASGNRVKIEMNGDEYKMFVDNREVKIYPKTDSGTVKYKYKDADNILNADITDAEILKKIEEGNKAFIDSTQDSLRDIVKNRSSFLEGEESIQDLVATFGEMGGQTAQGVKSTDIEDIIENVMVLDPGSGKMSLNSEYKAALNDANTNLNRLGIQIPEDTFIAAINKSKDIDGSVRTAIVDVAENRQAAAQVEPTLIDDIESFKNAEAPPPQDFRDIDLPWIKKGFRFLFGIDDAAPGASDFKSLRGYKKAAVTSLVAFYDSALAIRKQVRTKLVSNPLVIDIDVVTNSRTIDPSELPLVQSSAGLQVEIIAVDPRGPMIGRLKVKDNSAAVLKRDNELKEAGTLFDALKDTNATTTIPIDTGTYKSGEIIDLNAWKTRSDKTKADLTGAELNQYTDAMNNTEVIIKQYNFHISNAQTTNKAIAAGELGKFVVIDGRHYSKQTQSWMQTHIDSNKRITDDLATYYRVVNDANVKSKSESVVNSLYKFTRNRSSMAVVGARASIRTVQSVQSDSAGNMTLGVPTFEGDAPVIIDTSSEDGSPADKVTIGNEQLAEIIDSTSTLSSEEIYIRLDVE